MDGETNLNNIDTFIKQFLTDFFDITLLIQLLNAA